MFDNPRKSLARMQEELLAAERGTEEWETPEEEDPEEALEEMKTLLRREEWNEREREPLSQRYQREDDEVFTSFLEDEPEAPIEKPRRKSSAGLVFVAILEMLGALALVGWLLWLR